MSHFHYVKGPKAHTHSVWLYWGVFLALVSLTILTVALASVDFGKYSVIVTLLIAGTKALLVLGVFMHLAFDNKFFALIVGTSFIFLSLFIIFPLLDMKSRSATDSDQANFLPRNEKVFDHAKENPQSLPLRPGLNPAQEKELNFTKPGEH